MKNYLKENIDYKKYEMMKSAIDRYVEESAVSKKREIIKFPINRDQCHTTTIWATMKNLSDHAIRSGRNVSDETINDLLQNLVSNPYAISHFMITKYLTTHVLTNISDVSIYALKCYLDCTVRFHNICVM
jgi:hypothetical protein